MFVFYASLGLEMCFRNYLERFSGLQLKMFENGCILGLGAEMFKNSFRKTI